MVTGGTSAFPGWGVWLAIAIVATSVAFLGLVVLVSVTRFRGSRRGRIAVAVLFAAAATCWVVYRVESNERWASRALVVEVGDIFADTRWAEDRTIRVDTEATEGCANDNGAVATLRQRSSTERPFNDMDRADNAAALAEFEAVRRRLEQDGFAVEKASVEEPSAQRLWLWLARDDEALRIVNVGVQITVRGASNICNSQRMLSRLDDDRWVDVETFDLESICSADLEGDPANCP